ncbi:acyl-CoA dehydrogenase family protein [Roseibium limicola]|uniref:Acyl-CoA/acyl-ACP dehydrogenase n=1 Tax=Roseibium limicola TaxID=2816037 RepID=A0A939ELY6_9HYPH|nr:acyl-CoA dehydrogenase family protein [Roseibium limicola]MBO0344252.1 acyl-CoA/acyl-ACP dehydrogenase [Roseibium limicola]
MPLEFFRTADDRLLFDAVSNAFSADRQECEPDAPDAESRAAMTIGRQGLIQPVNMPGRSAEGVSLIEASAIVEAAGMSQVPFALSESLVLVSALTAAGTVVGDGLLNGDEKVGVAPFSHVNSEVDWVLHPGAIDANACNGQFKEGAAGQKVEVDLDLRPLLWVLMAADILGSAQAMFDKSLGFMGERHQFGQPLSSYQALRHRAADDWVLLEDMRAAIDYAAVLFDSAAEPGEILQAARIAKATASHAGPVVAENAIQHHGAVGFTWEFGLHFGLKRIKSLSLRQGTASDHYRLIGEQYLADIAKTFVNSGA